MTVQTLNEIIFEEPKIKNKRNKEIIVSTSAILQVNCVVIRVTNVVEAKYHSLVSRNQSQ